MGSRPVKKGRHRRFEEARALKRSTDIDFDRLLESLQKDGPERPGRADDEDAYDDLDEDEDDDAR
jgi:hypothetical protein